MITAPLSSLLQSAKPVLFKTDGLDAAGIAKIEGSVKSAKDTLALADHLQTMRDVNRAVMAVSDSLKQGANLTGKNLVSFFL